MEFDLHFLNRMISNGVLLPLKYNETQFHWCHKRLISRENHICRSNLLSPRDSFLQACLLVPLPYFAAFHNFLEKNRIYLSRCNDNSKNAVKLYNACAVVGTARSTYHMHGTRASGFLHEVWPLSSESYQIRLKSNSLPIEKDHTVAKADCPIIYMT